MTQVMTITCDVCHKVSNLDTAKHWVNIVPRKVPPPGAEEYPRPFDLCSACADKLRLLLGLKAGW